MESGELVLSSIYAPAGNPEKNGKARAIEIKAAWLNSLRKYVDKRLNASRRIVLCGDFNVPDHPEIPKPQDSRQLQLLSQLGFVDLYRHLHPKKKGNNYGFDLHQPPVSRLSRALGTRSVAAVLRRAWVDLDYRQAIPGHGEWKWARSAPLIVDIG